MTHVVSVVISPEHTTLGRGVRKARKAKSLSQEKLAEAAGLHRNYVGLLERGERNPSAQVLFDLAKALGVSPAILFSEF